MSILPFKKKSEDSNLHIINELRDIRTKKKQLAIQEKVILEKMDAARSPDNFLYDMSNNPIAKLSIYSTTSFDSKKFKEEHPDLYAEFPKLSTTRRWGLL